MRSFCFSPLLETDSNMVSSRPSFPGCLFSSTCAPPPGEARGTCDWQQPAGSSRETSQRGSHRRGRSDIPPGAERPAQFTMLTSSCWLGIVVVVFTLTVGIFLLFLLPSMSRYTVVKPETSSHLSRVGESLTGDCWTVHLSHGPFSIRHVVPACCLLFIPFKRVCLRLCRKCCVEACVFC